MAQIASSRYFPLPLGNAAVSVVSEDLGSGAFKATVQLPAEVVFTGTSNEVMDGLADLADHLAAAREAILTYLTES